MAIVYPYVCSGCGKSPEYYFSKEEDLHILQCTTKGCKWYGIKSYYYDSLCGKSMAIQVWNQHQEFRNTMKKLFDMIDSIKDSNKDNNIDGVRGKFDGQFFEIIHPEYNRVEILFTDNKFTVIHNVIRIKIVDDTLDIIRYGDDMHFKLSNIKEYSMGPTRKEV